MSKSTLKLHSTKLKDYNEGSKSASRQLIPELRGLHKLAPNETPGQKMSARSSNTVSRNEGQGNHKHHFTHVIHTSRHSIGAEKSDLVYT